MNIYHISTASLKVYAHVQNAYTFVFFTYNKAAEQNLIPVRKEPRPVAAPTAFSVDKLLRVLGAEESSDRKGKVMMYFFVGHDKNMYMYNLHVVERSV